MRSSHRKREKRRGSVLLAAGLAGVLSTSGLTALAYASGAEDPAARPAAGDAAGPYAEPYQMDDLDRGLISVGSGDGNLVSWRLLATDPDDVAFNVYRDGTKINDQPLTDRTNFLDEGAPAGAEYTVSTVADGVETKDAAQALNMPMASTDVPISRPGDNYTANDASVGDVNGDGELDIVLKWYPDDAKDNAQEGVTSNTYIDAYTLGGEQLWRIDLGHNIRSGAHYTQFQVFDYDGDGSAEVAMKTADATVDGEGTVIGDANADYRNDGGYILDGPEYLTIFDGETGAAIDTVDYAPPRGNVADWGDDYGNRVDRFLAGTAYLDGESPSLIMARGYYTRSVIAAWDFDGTSLTQRWVFDSDEAGGEWAGQGSHSLSVGDIDEDGRDEIVYGAMAVDDDGTGMWSTGSGHGDAQHLGDFDPNDPGLEYFKVSESGSSPSSLFIDPATGDVLWETPAAEDNGRGVGGDIWADNPGGEYWSANVGSMMNGAGEEIGRKPDSMNFLSWWDGDTTRELLDDTHIDKYGPDGDTRLLTGEGVVSGNGTKATPALSADILGDWREEVVWATSDHSALRIYSTDDPTDTEIPALMQDRQYRTGVAWQNTAYNQPPHPGFYIGPDMAQITPSMLNGVPAGR
jgi:rhamnogalacturonan endolyase